MGKQEFIDRLRTALNGRVAPSLVVENLNYYEDYINTEIRKGRPENEVLAALGDPRLIARTIIETSRDGADDQGQAAYGEYRHQDPGAGYGNPRGAGGSYEGYGQGAAREERRYVRLPGWVWLLAAVLIVVLIIGTVFSLLSFLLPVLLPILLVFFLIKLFRDWLN